MFIFVILLIDFINLGIQAGCASADNEVANQDDIDMQKFKIDISLPHKKGKNPNEHNNNIVPNENKPKKKCCPYDFDSSICRTVGDRVVCGYNKNQGSIDCKEKVKELGEGCRLRKGRVECGYVQPPYTNPRRPSATNIDPSIENILPTHDDKQRDPNTDKHKKDPRINDVEIVDGDEISKEIEQLKMTKGPKNCIVIKDRIVCRYDRK